MSGLEMPTTVGKMTKKDKAMMDEWQRTVDFRFNGKKVPEGFEDLDVEETVTVMLSGKVSQVAADAEGKSFSIVWDKVDIQRPEEKPKSMKEAVNATRKEW
jgi:hypothetical protein